MNQNPNSAYPINGQDARSAELGTAVNNNTNPDWGILNFFISPQAAQQQQNQYNAQMQQFKQWLFGQQ
jgi:hypothetical protein